MTQIMRSTVVIGLLVILGMLLIPPWTTRHAHLQGLMSVESALRLRRLPGDTVEVRVVRRYAPLWSEPKPVGTGTITDGGQEPWQIDTLFLLFQLGIAAVVTGVLIAVVPRPETTRGSGPIVGKKNRNPRRTDRVNLWRPRR